MFRNIDFNNIFILSFLVIVILSVKQHVFFLQAFIDKFTANAVLPTEGRAASTIKSPPCQPSVIDIPLNEVAINTLVASTKNIPRGGKLFVPLNQKAHQAIQRVQDFIKNNRYKVIDPLNTRADGIKITMHSFRHAYAKEHYDRFITNGYSEEEARLKVSKLIGHHREDVTKIYLAQN